MTTTIPSRLAKRPTFKGLVVPYMVDAKKRPIDFKAVDKAHVDRCAQERACGVCGERVRPGKDRYVFLGPLRDLQCFGDPWMHEDCGEYTALACPFVSGKHRRWHAGPEPILQPFLDAWMMVVSRQGRVQWHMKSWHFQPVDIKTQATFE